MNSPSSISPLPSESANSIRFLICSQHTTQLGICLNSPDTQREAGDSGRAPHTQPTTTLRAPSNHGRSTFESESDARCCQPAASECEIMRRGRRISQHDATHAANTFSWVMSWPKFIKTSVISCISAHVNCCAKFSPFNSQQYLIRQTAA